MGAFFAMLKFSHAIDIILFFAITSFCIAIILKFGISLIVQYSDLSKKESFSEDYDNHLEQVRIHINKLEKESKDRINKIHNLGIDKLMNKKRQL